MKYLKVNIKQLEKHLNSLKRLTNEVESTYTALFNQVLYLSQFWSGDDYSVFSNHMLNFKEDLVDVKKNLQDLSLQIEFAIDVYTKTIESNEVKLKSIGMYGSGGGRF